MNYQADKITPLNYKNEAESETKIIKLVHYI